MPAKKKAKGKGKKGAKGKKGKGKKGAKKKVSAKASSSADGPSKEALLEAAMWEGRLKATEDARKDFRVVARQLAADNEAMQDQLMETERDTLEVVAFLKRESQGKDDQIVKLQQQVKDLRRETRKEHELLVNEFSGQINNLEDELSQKKEEIEVMNAELKLVKEFRKKRAIMQRELDELREKTEVTQLEHQQVVSQMDRKHIEEKSRLQKEADRKVTELAQEAHQHAISKLDEAAKDVFRGNVRLKDALKLHMDEGQQLQSDNAKLVEENHRLKQAQETDRLVHEERAAQAMRLKKQNSHLTDKILSLEQMLSKLVKDVAAEKESYQKEIEQKVNVLLGENMSLRQTLQIKSLEMNKVKLVAKRILDQRASVEDFFISALAHVRKEVDKSRADYKQTAKVMYERKMLDAFRGKTTFPQVRTFTDSSTSTNSVFSDMKVADEWPERMQTSADLDELTWEQKEQVLRLLFSKMNSATDAPRRSDPLPAIEVPKKRAPVQPGRTSTPGKDQLASGDVGSLLAITDGAHTDRHKLTPIAPGLGSGKHSGLPLSLGTGASANPGDKRLSTDVDLT